MFCSNPVFIVLLYPPARTCVRSILGSILFFAFYFRVSLRVLRIAKGVTQLLADIAGGPGYKISYEPLSHIYLFIYLLFSHNKDYTSITLYKDVARGPQKTTRLVRGGPLVIIILSNRTTRSVLLGSI